LTVVLVLASCSSAQDTAQLPWTPVPAPDLGAVVARVGEVPILAEQIRALALQTGKPPRQALADLIDIYLLAEQAWRTGFALTSPSDPDITQALVQRLLEVELEPGLRYEALPDSALRPLYERGRDAFVHGRLVEIGVLAIYTGVRMKDKPRRERASAARELAAHLGRNPPQTLEEFEGVARAPEWSSRGVVFLRFLQGPDRPLSQAVWAEVEKLRVPGQTTRMVEDEDGFFVARYLGERPPKNVSFEEARAALRAGYYERWRQQRFMEFTAKLMRLHHVEAHFDRLSQDQHGP